MAKDTNNTAAANKNKLHPFIKKIILLLWHNINMGQLDALKDAAERGEFEKEFISIIAAIAADIEKDPTAPAEDPASPIFNIEAFRQAILNAGGFDAANNCFNDIIVKEMGEAAEIEISENFRKAFEETNAEIAEMARAALSRVTEFIQSEIYKKIKESVAAVSSFVQEHKADFDALRSAAANYSGITAEIYGLIPFLQMELDEAAQNDPQLQGKTVADILRHGIKANGEIAESPYKGIIFRAKQQLKEYEEAKTTIEEVEQAATELPRIISNPTDKINYPLDKPNSVIWNLITTTDPDGQIKMQIDTSKKGSKQDAIIYYGINFDEIKGIEITKQLTPFDKRCYIAAAALFNAGNHTISATQVYYMMGNATPPNTNDLQKVNDSLTKMGAARVYIDNERETKAAKGYQLFKYDAALLPFERIGAYINGQLTESAIHLFREPPLMSFARQRNQITTVSRQLLESPVSKTDANLRIDDYLLERIGHMKSGKGKAPRKILFSTLHKQCDIKTAKQKQRAPEKIRRYLDYYKKCGWIKDYTMDDVGITILL